MNAEAPISTEVALLPTADNLPALFASAEMIDKALGKIEAAARAFVPDLSTDASRKRIASMAFKVSQSKTLLDKAGLSLTSEYRAKTAAVNAERTRITARLDALRDEVRKPLTDWEVAEGARIGVLTAQLDAIGDEGLSATSTSAALADVIERLAALPIDATWQEFQGKAAIRKDEVLTRLRADLVTASTREREQAELARLRREAAEREQAEAQAAVARAKAEAAAADEKARREATEAAERAAQEAAERARQAEAERLAQIERAKAEAAQIAADQVRQQERDAAEARQRQTEREAAEAIAQAEREKQAAIDKAASEAHARQAEIDAEASRVETERRAKEKREADLAHRETIRKAIVAALLPISDPISAPWIADALIAGLIPYCEISF